MEIPDQVLLRSIWKSKHTRAVAEVTKILVHGPGDRWIYYIYHGSWFYEEFSRSEASFYTDFSNPRLESAYTNQDFELEFSI